jgi:hypothetical protein
MGCTVCQSGNREAIDAALRRGESTRKLAAQFGLGRNSIFRHSCNCIRLRREFVDERKQKAEIERRALAGDVESAYKKACERLDRAEASGDLVQVLKAQAGVNKLLALRERGLPRIRGEQQITTTDPKSQLRKALRDQGTRAFCVTYEGYPVFDTNPDLRNLVSASASERADAVVEFRVVFRERKRLEDVAAVLDRQNGEREREARERESSVATEPPEAA